MSVHVQIQDIQLQKNILRQVLNDRGHVMYFMKPSCGILSY